MIASEFERKFSFYDLESKVSSLLDQSVRSSFLSKLWAFLVEIETKSADVILKMTTMLKEMRKVHNCVLKVKTVLLVQGVH